MCKRKKILLFSTADKQEKRPLSLLHAYWGPLKHKEGMWGMRWLQRKTFYTPVRFPGKMHTLEKIPAIFCPLRKKGVASADPYLCACSVLDLALLERGCVNIYTHVPARLPMQKCCFITVCATYSGTRLNGSPPVVLAIVSFAYGLQFNMLEVDCRYKRFLLYRQPPL